MTIQDLFNIQDNYLKHLTPVFIDVETYTDDKISLKTLTLRQYIEQTRMMALGIAIGTEEPSICYFDEHGKPEPDTEQVIEALRVLADDPGTVFVAHNAAFDIRVLRYKLDIPQPRHVWCTMEGAMGAWPDLPGGYSLDNCCRELRLPRQKFNLDIKALYAYLNRKRGGRIPERLAKQIHDIIVASEPHNAPQAITKELAFTALYLYNKRDIEATQDLYFAEIDRIPYVEQRIALMTHRVRRNSFVISEEKLNELVRRLDEAAKNAESTTELILGDKQDIQEIFSHEPDGSLRSIRYLRLRKIINEKLDAPEFDSTSIKRINPVLLAARKDVAAVLEQTARVSKMIFHKRRASVFRGIDEVDVELGYMRAITGRFSSPSIGKGLNIHNVPKHDKEIARPVRQLFRVPDHLCLVRGDLANVEYRIEGALTDCQTVVRMFERDVFADPYCEAWYHMTGQRITKGMPIRQVSKSAVLGLGFQMSPSGYAKILLKAVSTGDVSKDMLFSIARELGWKDPGKPVDLIVENLHCERIIAVSAYHIHQAFQKAHPEFNMTAEWLVRAVSAAVSANDAIDPWSEAQRILDEMMESPAAPRREMIYLEVDRDRTFPKISIRVRCGPWVSTLCWREPDFRRLNNWSQAPELTIRKANGTIKPFTKQLAIENVTQAAARNALCYGLLQLEKLGYEDILHVHDEVMLIVPKNRESVLKARDDLLSVFGPHAKDKPLNWAVLIKPEEISVTQSLYEDETDIAKTIKNKDGSAAPGPDRWGKIERNEPGCLDNLP